MPLGRIGKYDRVDVLGHGASGIVYLAWDTLLKKQIALKEVDLQVADVERFLEEARLLDRLDHPNIVRVNGVDTLEGRVVLDMEYVRGQTLQQIMREEGRLSVDRALAVSVQILDALDYAHKHNTIHRDIKPANILIDRQGAVKLVDFGLAEILATNAYAGGAGTYAYMAPEDFDEHRHSDHRSDIWAAGVMVYEMITGERPFRPAKPRDPFAWRRHLHEEPAEPLTTHLEAIPRGLQSVLDRALAVDKADRYPTAGEFRDDLVSIQQERSPVYARVPVRTHEANGNGNGNGRDYHDLPQITTNYHNLPGVALLDRDEPMPAPASLRQLGSVPAFVPQPAELQTTATPLQPLEIEPPRKAGWLSRRREAQPIHVHVQQREIDFGEVRKGDERTLKIRAKIEGGNGRVVANIANLPEWLEAYPAQFSKRRQDITLILRSGRAWQTGNFRTAVRIEAEGSSVEVAAHATILPARARFAEVALWFVPLFFAAMLPALTIAWGAAASDARPLVPAAASASGLLSLMLLQISLQADLGAAERTAAGVMACVMATVVGANMGLRGVSPSEHAMRAILAVAVPIAFMLIIQTFSRRYWRMWCVVLVGLSLLSCSAFLKVLDRF